MCVDRMTVFSVPIRLINSLISMICEGSRPVVGSSRIRMSGSWIIVIASPTRCLNPFESSATPLWTTEPKPQTSTMSRTRESILSAGIPRISAMKRRCSMTPMSR